MWAQGRGVQSSPLPLTTLPLHVHRLVHTPVHLTVENPISQDSIMTLLTTSPEEALSPPSQAEVRPQT